MTDLEIIKKNFNIITESEGYDYWYELEKEAIDAATRMAAEIERLKAALAEKPDIVRCWECIYYHGGIYTSAEDVESSQPPCCYYFGIYINDNDFCSYGTREEAKDED